jgi:hypothetical protein
MSGPRPLSDQRAGAVGPIVGGRQISHPARTAHTVVCRSDEAVDGELMVVTPAVSHVTGKEQRDAAAQRYGSQRCERLIGTRDRLVDPEGEVPDAADERQVQVAVGVTGQEGLVDAWGASTSRPPGTTRSWSRVWRSHLPQWRRARLVDHRDDDPAERREGYRDQLEVRQSERDADDREG